MQSQVRFNRVPENVPEKVPGSFGAKPGQDSTDSGEGCRECFGEGSGEGCREGSGEVRFSPFFVFVHVHASERSVKINVAAVGGTTEA